MSIFGMMKRDTVVSTVVRKCHTTNNKQILVRKFCKTRATIKIPLVKNFRMVRVPVRHVPVKTIHMKDSSASSTRGRNK